MITIEKLKEFEKYHGYFDGFYMQKIKNNTNLTSEREWYIIESLFQDCKLLKNGLVSLIYHKEIEHRIKENFETEESIFYFMTLLENDW